MNKSQKVFCTIITNSHLPYSKTLFESLIKYDNDILFFTLIVDQPTDYHLKPNFHKNFQTLGLESLSIEKDLIKKLSDKYEHSYESSFRWALKPLLLLHLIHLDPKAQIFFCDPDIYFTSDYSVLYDELDNNSFLLSPHWRSLSPFKNESEFIKQFTQGMFNGGFIGVTINAKETLIWWAQMCLYSCDRNSNFIYTDQAYLNLIPLLSKDTKILQHRGCNIAEWNKDECKRTVSSNNKLLINSIYSIVFIHFSKPMDIIENDHLLMPFLLEYDAALQKNGNAYSVIERAEYYLKKTRQKRKSFLERIISKVFRY